MAANRRILGLAGLCGLAAAPATSATFQLGVNLSDSIRPVTHAASGSLYGKIWKGLHEFEELGLIDKVNTRMSGCQASGCAPIVTAYENNTLNFKPVRPNTIARSLAIGNPADGFYSQKVIRESGGWAENVNEVELGVASVAAPIRTGLGEELGLSGA